MNTHPNPTPDNNPEAIPEPQPEPTDTSSPTVKVPARFDLDANWGAKTRKDGGTEGFYGYQEHTLVQVPETGQNYYDAPAVITRLEVTPAATDIVDVTLDLLDRNPGPVRELIADRHYHYKAVDRWGDQLADRGIAQVHDLRSDEHGFSERDHVRWVAGWPHCPATPDRYGRIERPAVHEADSAKMRAFHNLIEQREAYALRRVTTPDPRGVARWECPAAAGKIGCPHRAGTTEVAIELGQPVVENPPDLTTSDAPACCTQGTKTLDPGPLRKLMQRHYWGSRAWEAAWAKRTYVEGSYGNRKNPSTENLRRGHTRLAGVARMQMVATYTAVAYNLRMIRNAHAHTQAGDPDHPYLHQPDDPTIGNIRVTPGELDTLLAARQSTDDGD